MWRAPQTSEGKIIDAEHHSKSLCATERQFFVQCEIELPVAGKHGKSLGFICWVEVSRDEYERLVRYRANETSEPPYRGWVDGILVNSMQGVPQAYGTPVKFAVLKGDPTPYIKWIAPGTPLATRVEAGATQAFWHDVASAFETGAP
jgi:hypothetical protein